MAKKEYCPTCGQPIMKHRHTFSRALAGILLIVANKYGTRKPFHLQKDLDLTPNQYNNFQKLKYWDLVFKHSVQGKRIGGYWFLTTKAQYFIRGLVEIPRYVVTFNNQVTERSEERINMGQAYGFYRVPEQWADIQKKIGIGQQDLIFMNPKL